MSKLIPVILLVVIVAAIVGNKFSSKDQQCELAQINWDFSNRTNAVITIEGVDYRGVGWREPQTGSVRCIVVEQIGVNPDG